MLLDDVKCTGMEAGLGACAHKPWGQSNCGHSEDAGVICLSSRGMHVGLFVFLLDCPLYILIHLSTRNFNTSIFEMIILVIVNNVLVIIFLL